MDTDVSETSLLSDPNTALILELMLLTDTEWCELRSKCDNSVVQYDWLTSDTLFDPQTCQMISTKSMDTTGVSFVFSSIATVVLFEKLLQQQTQNALNNDLLDLIAGQLKHIFISDAYVSIKSMSSLKSNCFSKFERILTESLTNILQLTKTSGLNEKIGQILLKKSIEDNGVNSQAFNHFIKHFADKDSELQHELSFENLNYNKIVTFQKYSQLLSQNRLNEYLVQSLNAFICCERFMQLDDGIAKLAVIQSCLKRLSLDSDDGHQELTETITTIMDTFCGLKESNSGLFYYKNDIEADSDLQFYSLIIQTFTSIVDKYWDKLTQTHWDLILCSSTSWLTNIINKKEKLSKSLSINIFATRVLDLIQTICKTFDAKISSASNDKYPANLLEEWNEFHSPNLFLTLIPFYMEICAKELNFYGDILIKNLSKTVTLFTDSVINDLLSQIPYKHSLTVQKMAKPYDYICLPQNKENCFNTFCPLVVNPRHSIALSAHRLMIKFIPFLMRDVIQTTEVLDREEEENLLSPPKTILSLLEQMDGIIDTMLSEYLIGDCICVV
ncbi:unnamed protein product, partial [Oppiella nova]